MSEVAMEQLVERIRLTLKEGETWFLEHQRTQADFPGDQLEHWLWANRGDLITFAKFALDIAVPPAGSTTMDEVKKLRDLLERNADVQRVGSMRY